MIALIAQFSNRDKYGCSDPINSILEEAPSLTKIIEALEAFQEFEPDIKATAITLCASDLRINTLHFYLINLYAGLGGQR